MKTEKTEKTEKKESKRNYVLTFTTPPNFAIGMGGKRKLALEMRDYIRAKGAEARVTLLSQPKEID